jgi:hypothetical protein
MKNSPPLASIAASVLVLPGLMACAPPEKDNAGEYLANNWARAIG